MAINVKEIEQKTYKYSQQDGFFEMFLGLFFIFYGGFCYDVFSGFTTEIPHIPFILFFAFSMYIIEVLRRKITYPRIGKVKMTEKLELWYIVAVLLPLVLFPLIMYCCNIFGRDTAWVKWAPAFFGVVLAGLFHDYVKKTGDLRYYAFAILSVISGIGFSVMQFQPVITGILFFFLIMGGILFIFGLGSLIKFVYENPVDPEVST